MFFDIPTLEKRKIRFEEVFPAGSVEFADANWKQHGDLKATGVAELVDPFGVREIRVRGEIAGEMEVQCARCLDPIRIPVSSPVDLFYRPMDQVAPKEDAAIHEAETEVGFYDGGVELADVVREQVVLTLPMRGLCREDCRGLCPTCGANRNGETCSCQESFPDPRWEHLRHWKQ